MAALLFSGMASKRAAYGRINASGHQTFIPLSTTSSTTVMDELSVDRVPR